MGSAFELSDTQKGAVNSDAPRICIVACAGSGKTTTLTQRIARLVNSGIADASSVVAITFTTMAADRLISELSQLLQRSSDMSRMFIGTIHSFCLELLRASDPLAAESIRVLDDAQRAVVLSSAWNAWSLSDFATTPTTPRSRVIESIVASLDVIRLDNVNRMALKSAHPAVAELAERYRTYFRDNAYFDFVDLLTVTRGLLNKDDKFRQDMQSRFKWIFVDEYQDVDPAQAEIIELVSAGGHLCVVGDDDQAIYQFRGADVRNIRRLVQAGSTAVFTLDENRRCRDNIVRVAEAVVGQCQERIPKSLTTTRAGGSVVVAELDTVDAEAEWIVSEIQKLRATGQAYGTIAVLARSLGSYGERYIAALRGASIPFIPKGDRSLFDVVEVRLIIACLEVMNKEVVRARDIAALAVACGDPASALLEGRDADVSFWSADEYSKLGFQPETTHVASIALRLREAYFSRKFDTTLAALQAVMSELGIFAHGSEVARYNLGRFTQAVAAFDDIDGSGNLSRLCNYLATFADGNFDQASPPLVEVDAVTVMTVHQAKGLEFDTVFVAGLSAGRFPVTRREDKWIVDASLFDSARYQSDEDSERRLFYVAATRARNRLYLSRFTQQSGGRKLRPSTFFTEACAVTLDSDRSVDPPPTHIAGEGTLVTSYSQLEYYLACPYRYKLLLEHGVRFPPNPFFAFGQAVHTVARALHEAAKAGRQLTAAEAEMLFDRALRLPKEQPTYRTLRRREALLEALARYATDHRDWLERTESVEVPFSLATADGVVNGRIDLIIVAEDGGSEIVDWKTGDQRQYLRSSFQMGLYSLAARDQLGLDVQRARLYFIESETTVEYPATETFLHDAAETLSSALLGIRQRQFHPTPGAVCKFCECRPICAYAAP